MSKRWPAQKAHLKPLTGQGENWATKMQKHKATLITKPQLPSTSCSHSFIILLFFLLSSFLGEDSVSRERRLKLEYCAKPDQQLLAAKYFPSQPKKDSLNLLHKCPSCGSLWKAAKCVGRAKERQWWSVTNLKRCILDSRLVAASFACLNATNEETVERDLLLFCFTKSFFSKAHLLWPMLRRPKLSLSNLLHHRAPQPSLLRLEQNRRDLNWTTTNTERCSVSCPVWFIFANQCLSGSILKKQHLSLLALKRNQKPKTKATCRDWRSSRTEIWDSNDIWDLLLPL